MSHSPTPPKLLVPCPGCGLDLHPRAVECPECGFRAELTAYQDLLGSLSTISSILLGFGLASLVTLVVAVHGG